MSLTMYHNPCCSKSRATLALLQEHGREPDLMLYLKTPPTVQELKAVLRKLKLAPRELLRTWELVYTELGLADANLSDEAILEAMVANPILIERPIVITGDAAAIGRPPESVLDIL